jgi:hypothetical protein
VSVPYDREDVKAILSALFDIKADLRDIRNFLLPDDEPEEEADA